MRPGLSLRLNHKFVTLLVCALAAASCNAAGNTVSPAPTVPPEFTDTSLLSGEPCAAPCWYGLELGVSTKARVRDTIEILRFLDLGSLTEMDQTYYFMAGP